MTHPEDGLYYGDYLQLEKLLGAQTLESTRAGSTAHDEMLFIIVHQAYELWFKQILWELDAVMGFFGGEVVDEMDVGRAVAHLERIVEIQRVLLQQIDILETMTPLDFLDFRDYLIPASGFQSVQFRQIEIRLGLRGDDRMKYGNAKYTTRLMPEDRARIESAEAEPSLFDRLERWLARTPFLAFGDFAFWETYREAIEAMLARDRHFILGNETLTEAEKAKELKGLDGIRDHFEALFNPEKYEAMRADGRWRLSHQALQAALLINLYRDEPILNPPFRVLSLLMDIDEQFTTWRYRHALMVLRMIGSKIGTGGSSGHAYLQATAHQHKVFGDLFHLSTFIIPRSELPTLPDAVVRSMGFTYKG